VKPGRRDLRIADTGVVELIGELTLAPDNLSRESIVRLYDHEVQGRTVVKPLQGPPGHATHGDAAVLRPSPDSWRGLAMAVAAQPWACRDDPKRGAISVVEEVARNLYAVGARPDALTNCLNFGSPEDPAVLGDLAACVEGLAEGAQALGMAVPSGNVSLYNEGLGRAIPPTPVLLGTGLVDDLRRSTTSELKEEGDLLYLLGRSRPELGGSLVARRAARTPLAVPPTDPRILRKLGERLLKVGPEGGVRAVHDVSDGGLGVTLCEMAFGSELGFVVDLGATGLPGPGLAAVAEGGSRWVVEVARASQARFERAFRSMPCTLLGETNAGGEGRFNFGNSELGTVALEALYERWRVGLVAA
jgi:phosphoribosylformylglycinamidine synthase